MQKKVLVTGGCGFIGANLVPQLLAKNYQVCVFDNLSKGNKAYIADYDCDFIEGDVRDGEALDQAMKEVSVVIHLAAYGSVVESIEDPINNFEINGQGTLNALEAAKKNKLSKFIMASTGGALIGDTNAPVDENSIPKPISPYGASKLVGEGYCSAYAGSYDLPTVILRFGNVYGPISAHKKGVITLYCKNLMNGIPLTVFGDGKSTRDYVYVEDLCRGIIASIETKLDPATTLHISSGVETSIMSVCDTLMAIANKPNHPVEHRGTRLGEIQNNVASFERAKALINFQPQIMFEEGMKKTWEWFNKNN